MNYLHSCASRMVLVMDLLEELENSYSVMCILFSSPLFLFYCKSNCSFHAVLLLTLSPHFTLFLNDFGGLESR